MTFRISAFGDEIADSLDAQIASLRDHDVGFLELRSVGGTNVADFSDDAVERIGRRLAAVEIGISAIASPIGKSPIEGAFEIELDRFRRILTTACRLRTRLVRVFSFFIADGRYGEHRDEVVRRLAAMTREAEAAGVTLVLENESYVYGDTPERCRDLIEAVGSPALRLAFDPANFVQVGIRPYAEAGTLFESYVAHFHVKDAVPVDRTGAPAYPARVAPERLMDSVRLPGEGQAELRSLLRALAAGRYQGYLVSEPHLERRLPSADGSGRFDAAIGALRAVLESVERGV